MRLLEKKKNMEEHLLPSPKRGESISSEGFPFSRQISHHYDEEIKGNYLKYLLNAHYYVHESILLGKVYQVAPWKTGRYIWKAQRSLLFPLKLWSHIILIVLLSCLLLFINNQYGSYQRGMSMISCGFFLPKEKCDYSACVGYLSNQADSLESYSCSLYKVTVFFFFLGIFKVCPIQ